MKLMDSARRARAYARVPFLFTLYLGAVLVASLVGTAAHAVQPDGPLNLRPELDTGLSDSDGIINHNFRTFNVNSAFVISGSDEQGRATTFAQTISEEWLYMYFRTARDDSDDCSSPLPGVFDTRNRGRDNARRDWTYWGRVQYRTTFTEDAVTEREIERSHFTPLVSGQYCFLVTYSSAPRVGQTAARGGDSVPSTYGTRKIVIDLEAPPAPTINYGPGISAMGTERRPTFVVGLESTRARTGLYSDDGCRTSVSDRVTYPSTTSVALRPTRPLAFGNYNFYASETDEAGNSVCSGGLAYSQTQPPVAYDADGDGLIDIDSLEKLNAIRYDLDGNGRADSSGANLRYEQAFPDPQATPFMGCPGGACAGYELTGDLDFAGSIWSRTRSTQGWEPIGQNDVSAGAGTAWRTIFRGNGHTISNLYVNRPNEHAGLFRHLWHGAVIEGVGLINVDVTGGDLVGGLAASYRPTGGGSGSVSACYVTGAVRTQARFIGFFAAFRPHGTGGLIGLVGPRSVGGSFQIRASYATASVDTTVDNQHYGGGLVGFVGSRVTIVASYATGRVTGQGRRSFQRGGLIGDAASERNPSSRVTDSYWDRQASGQGSSGRGSVSGVSKTSRELRTPTDYTGIYQNWDLNLDGVPGGDNPWDFGTRTEYPVLRYGSRDTLANTATQLTLQPRASSEKRLSGLTITPELGLLIPAFDSATTGYTARLLFGAASTVTVAATAVGDRSLVDISAALGGDADPDAGGFQVAPIIRGATTRVTVTVTAEDYSTREYTLMIESPDMRSDHVDLAALSIAPGTLAPSFDAAITNYTADVDASVRSVTVTAPPNHRGASVRIDPGAMVVFGRGRNVITATVTAEDGVTEKAYVITVTREAATDADLAELSISSGVGAIQRFNLAGDTTRHSIVVPFAVSSVTVAALTRDDRARVSNINQVDADADAPGRQVSLTADAITTITITVTAEDGDTTKMYEVGVRREAASSNAGLDELRVIGSGLNRSFDVAGALTAHAITVLPATGVVTVVANPQDANAVREITPGDADTGVPGHQVNLAAGVTTTINIRVTAEDGSEKEYTITVLKSRGRLINLVVSAGVLNFRSTQTAYTLNVANVVTSLRVTATAIVADTTIQITDPAGDGSITAGAEATTIIGLPDGLNLGSNRVQITAMGSDGTTGTYTVDVVRAAPGGGQLIALSVAPGTLAPPFASGRSGGAIGSRYTVRVPHGVTSVRFMTTLSPLGSGNSNYRAISFHRDGTRFGGRNFGFGGVAETRTTTRT